MKYLFLFYIPFFVESFLKPQIYFSPVFQKKNCKHSVLLLRTLENLQNKENIQIRKIKKYQRYFPLRKNDLTTQFEEDDDDNDITEEYENDSDGNYENNSDGDFFPTTKNSQKEKTNIRSEKYKKSFKNQTKKWNI